MTDLMFFYSAGSYACLSAAAALFSAAAILFFRFGLYKKIFRTGSEKKKSSFEMKEHVVIVHTDEFI